MSNLIDTCSLAMSHSPILTWSMTVAGGALVRFALAPSRDWLFVAACAVPYGIVAVMALV